MKERSAFLEIVLSGGIALLITILGVMNLSNSSPLVSPASAATDTVSVQTTIQEWISFSVAPTSTSLTPDLVDASGGTHIGSSTDITLTAGTNSANGYSIDAKDQNAGLCHSGGCGTHNISSGTTTLSAGTDGYGAQATSTDADVTIHSNFNYWGNDDVGGLETSDKSLADTAGSSSGDQTLFKLKAAAAASDPSGTYSDTVTLTCLGNP
ncbi:MAG: hypothetical protein GF370_02645 [Candidatus Nealsonbacteria bacterium]|nr:hypothetical protein [Candidatus Nealsonbacteria bacterium]